MPQGGQRHARSRGDGCKSSEDPDDDNDSALDGADACDPLIGVAANGCPSSKRTLTLVYKPAVDAFKGRLRPAGPCAGGDDTLSVTFNLGPDAVIGGSGADRLRAFGGGSDRVRCGRGQDKVSAGLREDSVADDCEFVDLT